MSKENTKKVLGKFQEGTRKVPRKVLGKFWNVLEKYWERTRKAHYKNYFCANFVTFRRSGTSMCY